MYEQDLALNNLQWLICHKTQPTTTLSQGEPGFGLVSMAYQPL